MIWVNKNRISTKIGMVFGMLRALLFFYVVYLIKFGNEPDWPMYWLIFLYVDFPISLVYFRVFDMFSAIQPLPNVIAQVLNVVVPFMFFGVLGTLWYLFLPSWIANIIQKFRKVK
ncbi:MAG: hypothetical protein COV74_00345 [Candidatus Omnitrophica bacterium CG11_big_fil_rev_8_21_14_0_20_45_26]|uniref:Uncharacterized protein n=1 Tax=Candidatus Abzuiibacterium crystallinum TaxID=1974748 RepID=A0A2H0LT65_9BACT|nr:MAG: hypothetical protein COV74_00345 [Candidatus Omnitrophica bacterium CG11_big_fil_rev_8_21_14_0_20_45_26]PIW64612.1 MAG: hypothetical protein COW12_05435 [Candidatus Omnitrophica bacterium CG12_big_fil_rev_8_21_14_0_65_45_16]